MAGRALRRHLAGGLEGGPPVPLAALALASSFLPGGFAAVLTHAALLSGPWGWALVPVLAACGQPTPLSWPLAASLLAAATVAATGWVLATAGGVPTEELSRHAELRRDLYASVYTTDFRGAALLGREATRRFVGWAAAFCGGGTLAALAHTQNPFVVLAAVLLGYLGASRLIETTRIETDAPGASLMLPYRYGHLLLLHALVPAALVAAVLALSCAAGYLFGLLPAVALPAALALCPLATARRSRTLTVEVMQAAVALGDAAAIAYFQWYALGPILALLALGVPGLLLAVASQGPSLPWAALLGAGTYLPLFALAGFRWLGKRRSLG